MDKQCNHNSLLNEIKETREALTQQISAQGSDVKILQHVVFGNEESHEKGMKEKVDEIHEIITQLKGLKWILGSIILVSATLVAVKSFLK